MNKMTTLRSLVFALLALHAAASWRSFEKIEMIAGRAGADR